MFRCPHIYTHTVPILLLTARLCSQQDESPGDSPPGTPPSFLDDDPEAAPFRRRAHTFSHPPVKKRISFTDTQAQAPKSPLRRQQSVAPELLQSRYVISCRIISCLQSSPWGSLSYIP